VTCAGDRVRGAHALEVARLGASRCAWNSDGMFGAGTQIEITRVWSRLVQ
jgi:hypothetical protein